MAITLTDAAAGRVKQFLDQRGKGVGLRLGVRTSGCSGMAYVLEFADEIGDRGQGVDPHEAEPHRSGARGRGEARGIGPVLLPDPGAGRHLRAKRDEQLWPVFRPDHRRD